MQKILRKRILRDLRENLFRYLALGFLIILGMYMIVSLVGAADTIIIGVAEHGEANRLEDGEFQVFVPLSEEETAQLTGKGITLERMFYLDFLQEDGSTLRVYRNREEINLLELDEGRAPEAGDEAVLEKRYCEENGICLGSTVQIGGETYRVVGIGTVPDYDAPYRSLADSSVDSRNFGLVFVTGAAYDGLKTGGKSVKSEEYIYAYRLNGKLTDDALKAELKEFELCPENVEDIYFQEYWKELVGEKEDFEEGISDLVDGTRELSEGAKELSDGAKELTDGARELSDGARELSDGTQELSEGTKELTDGAKELSDGIKELSDGTGELCDGAMGLVNGAKTLSDGLLEAAGGAGTLRAGMAELETQLTGLQMSLGMTLPGMEGVAALSGGSAALAEGVAALYNGSVALYDGSAALYNGSATLRDGSTALYDGSTALYDGSVELSDGAAELSDGAKELSDGAKELSDGAAELYDGSTELYDGSAELYDGMKELQDATDELMETYFAVEISNLIQFLPVEDNPRVGASADDQIINKQAGLAAGVIVMVLFTYVISVFVIHGIEKESSMIGTLYALGVKRRELLLHYLMLPVLITFISGIIGTAIGYSSWGVNVQMGDCYDYFSTPALATVYEPYLLAYGIVMPPVVAAVVNYFVIRKRLSQPALRLIRNEQKSSRTSNVDLGKLGFICRFRIRQMLRELRTGFAVWFGMFVCLLIMMLGINCYVLCEHISEENKADTKYAYMYTCKYPEKEVPEGGVACYAVTLKKVIYGYNLDITILGIDEGNPYFDVQTTPGKSRIVASSAMAQKAGLSVGDKLILTDEEEDMDYAFTVEDIAQFSTGLYVFMDIDSMRELFGADEDYYNVVFSDETLPIDSGRLYGVTSREDISKSSDVFVSLMMPMVIMMTVLSALIFGIVMYLMMKVMIDRSSFGISLMKIFGYRTREIRKLYLNGNFYTIAVGAAVGIPLSKLLMDAIYPYMISNVACGMNLTFSWQLYAGIYGGIILLYFFINRLLVGRLKKMVPAEVLKNRE